MYRNIVGRIFKDLLRFLEKHLGLNINHNAVYSKKDVIKPIIRASVENTTVESSCRRLKGISSDSVFYHLNKLSYNQIKQCLDKGIVNSFIKAKKKHRLTRATIAIDITDIPYYGEYNGMWVHNIKNGKAFKVMSVHIVEKGYRFTIAVIPLNVFYNKNKLVSELISIAKQRINIYRVLLDRAFESIAVINTLKQLNVKFIMPKKRNKKTVKLMQQCYLNGIERIEHRIECSGNYAEFDLVIYETDNDIVGFITNMNNSAGYIANLYRSRWGIETGYKMKNVFYGRTCANSLSTRFLLILLSFMLYNLWVLTNEMLEYARLDNITAGDMCILMVDIMINDIT